MGDSSTSTKVCRLINDIIHKNYTADLNVNIISLMDYDLKPCILCGSCSESSTCSYDNAFNCIYSQLSGSDGIFFVVPHYSPIPSKLLIILEKLNEFAYAGWLKDQKFVSPLSNIPVGIIGHGGCAETVEVLKYYHDSLISPVAKTLEALSLSVIGLNEEYPSGVPFGLKNSNCLKPSPNSIFPDIIQDFEMIQNRIEPLVHKVMDKIK
jgi:hypothetical protein